MKRIYSYLLICLLSLSFVQAQKQPTHLIVNKCHDDGSGTKTSFYEVQLYQVGKNTYKSVATFLSNGFAYSVPNSGSVSLGLCDDGMISSMKIVEKCHNNQSGIFTSFYQLVKYDENGNQTILSSFDQDGNSYSIPGTGTITLGFCSDYSSLYSKCVEYDKNLAPNHVIDYTLELSSSLMSITNIEYTQSGQVHRIPINYPYDLSNNRHRANIVKDLKEYFDCKKITYDEIEAVTEMTGDKLTKVTIRFKRPSVVISKYYNCINRDLSSSLETNLLARNVVTNGSSGAYTNKVRAIAYYDINDNFLFVKSELETLYSVPSGMNVVDCDIDCDLSDISIEEYKYQTRLPLKTFVLQSDYGGVTNVELQIWKTGLQDSTVYFFSPGYSESSSYQYAYQVSNHVSELGFLQNTDVKFYFGINNVDIVEDSTKIYLMNTYGIDSLKAKLSNGVILPFVVDSEKSYITFTVARNRLGGINSVIGDNGQKIYAYLPHGSEKLQVLSSLEESSDQPMTTTIDNITLDVEKCHDNGNGILTSFYEVIEFNENGVPTILGTYLSDGSSYSVPNTGPVTLGYCEAVISEKCIRYSKDISSDFTNTYRVTQSNSTKQHIISNILYGGPEGENIMPLNYPYDLSNQRSRKALERDIKELYECKNWNFKGVDINPTYVEVQKSSVPLVSASFIVPQTYFQPLNIDSEIAFQTIDFSTVTDNSTLVQYVSGKAYYNRSEFLYLIDRYGDISYSDSNMEFVICDDCDLSTISSERYKLKNILPIQTYCIDVPTGGVVPVEINFYPTTGNGTSNEFVLNTPSSATHLASQISTAISGTTVLGEVVVRPNGLLPSQYPTEICLYNVTRMDSITIDNNNLTTTAFSVENQSDFAYLTVLRNKLGGINKVISELGEVNLSYLPPGSVPIEEIDPVTIQNIDGSGTTTIDPFFEEIIVLCNSADVSINGVTYPANHEYKVSTDSRNKISTEYTISGSDYLITVIR